MNIKFLSLFFFALLIASPQAVAATVREQFKASVAELQKNPGDKALREKIIKLALKLKPKPAVPEEAERRMARGRAAVKAATDKEGFQDAVREYEKATLAAPWLAQAYYNLGIVSDKAGDYVAAMSNLKLYLLAAPGARNAKKVKSLLYELEYTQEKAEKKKHGEKELSATIESLKYKLRGIYNSLYCSIPGAMDLKCNEKEYEGEYWGKLPWRTAFTVLDNGLIIMRATDNQKSVYAVGIPNDPLLKNVQWSRKRSKTRGAFQIEGKPDGKAIKTLVEEDGQRLWVKLAEDGSYITTSRNRPLDSALYDPETRYAYRQYTRR